MPRLSEYPAEKARQGYIALNTPARRRVFFGGLAAFVLFMIVVSLLTGWIAV
ncbi:MAG TPA: peptide ABC transporter permease [Alphaproteobacteria bacterium]|nr:peptide ABC transporter permease [Alphaproteobacteria bacterium]